MLEPVRRSNAFYRRKLDGVAFDPLLADPIDRLPLTTRAELEADQRAPRAVREQSNLAAGPVQPDAPDLRHARPAPCDAWDGAESWGWWKDC